MISNNDPIGKALNLTPMQNKSIEKIVSDAHNDSAKNDFELARANIHEIIQNATDAIQSLSQIANSSQHPRAYEVLAKLMDSALQANKDLLELQTKIREIDSADKPTNDTAKTVHNNLFVGTTAELQKVIEDLNNGKKN